MTIAYVMTLFYYNIVQDTRECIIHIGYTVTVFCSFNFIAKLLQNGKFTLKIAQFGRTHVNIVKQCSRCCYKMSKITLYNRNHLSNIILTDQAIKFLQYKNVKHTKHKCIGKETYYP